MSDVEQEPDGEWLHVACAALARNLVGFGYEDATDELIVRYHADWLAGRHHRSGCFYFAAQSFAAYPETFGVPAGGDSYADDRVS